MKQKILMTLALLITAVGGAWAQDYDIDVDFDPYYHPDETHFNCKIMSLEPGEGIKGTLELSVDGVSKGSFGVDGEMVFGSIAAIDAGDHTWSAVFKPEGGGHVAGYGDFTIDKVHTSISYNGSTSINMGVGESTELDVYVSPDGPDGLSYSSSDASVASIIKKEYSYDIYIIQAKAAGTATITFSFAGNKNYDAAEDKTITVTVLPAPIEVTPGEAANTWTFTMPASSLVSEAFRRRDAASLVRTSEPSPSISRRWKVIFSRSVERGFSVNVKARQSYHSALPSNDVDRTGNTACTPSGICTDTSSSCHLAEDWSLNL